MKPLPIFCLICSLLPAILCSAATPDVTIQETERSFILNNGIIEARIEKSSGDVRSIQYRGVELLAQSATGGALGGYWSAVGGARGGGIANAQILVNPATNGSARAEVSCTFYNDPDAPRSPLDVEIHYSLGRGESGLYTYLVWRHQPGYPSFGVGEARFAAKLNPAVFDYMSIDKDRRRQMPTPEDWDLGSPLNLKEARRMTTGIHKGEAEHKYDYSALIYEIPAYGWSSTKDKLGFWFVNPSFEYMAGGPTKSELTGHLDVNPGGTPTLLNMWMGSHYGGSSLVVGTNEHWSKVVGPFLIYCNSVDGNGDVHERLWKDALAHAAKENAAWPYAWVTDTNYPPASQRSTVSGRIILNDPLAPNLKISNLWIGVTAPDYTPPPRTDRQRRFRSISNAPPASNFTNFPGRTTGNEFARSGFPPQVDWQRDAKHYQFWTRGDAEGRFTIPNVRPGDYTLHAIADGILGELTLTNVSIVAAEQKNLGTLKWTPMRYGKTLWEIGIADRTAREFRHGDHYWQWGLYFDYPKEFPDDVNFVIGTSDWRRDWNYVQPPRIESRDVPVVGEDDETPDAGPQLPVSGLRNIRSTTWSVSFLMTNGPPGEATLRLAFCGTHQGCNVEARVNGISIGETGTLPSTSAMQRDGIRAYWLEKTITFDAKLLQSGTNVLQLLSRANSWSQGVMYDYLRLELAQTPADPTATAK